MSNGQLFCWCGHNVLSQQFHPLPGVDIFFHFCAYAYFTVSQPVVTERMMMKSLLCIDQVLTLNTKLLFGLLPCCRLLE